MEKVRRRLIQWLRKFPSKSDSIDIGSLKGKKVNVVTEPKGWVLYHWAEELEKRLPYLTINAPVGSCPIDYFIPYYLLKKSPGTMSVAFFTHCEEGEDETSQKSRHRFFDVSKAADYCVCQNQKYADLLAKNGIERVEVITPGVDPSIFKPKLRLGWIGRTYWSGRKNEHFLKKLEDLDWIDLRYKSNPQHWSTIGRKAGEELTEFYRDIDYVLITSNAEGGPMSVIEGLASGVPIIMPEGVGLSSHFSFGIHTFEKNNFDALVALLQRLWEEKDRLANQVRAYSMDAWAEKNDRLFTRLLEEPDRQQ